MELKQFFTKYQTRVDAVLKDVLPSITSEPISLNQALHYTALSGGKRVRPIFVYATGLACDAPISQLDPFAASLELIHTYSLIHDDLPAMDDDDLRRGQPSCHKQFDEATAILAGDALQSLAFEIISQPIDDLHPEVQLRMIHIIANAAGPKGMVAGQALDIAAEGQQIQIQALENIHRNKTGALIVAAILVGALASQAVKPEQLEYLQTFAEYLGLCFQIHDDILDIEGDTTTLGKPQGSDLAQNKSTYPAILGMQKTKELEQQYLHYALDALAKSKIESDILKQLANYIIRRNH